MNEDEFSQLFGYKESIVDQALQILHLANVNIRKKHFCMLLCYGRVYPVVRQLPAIAKCSKANFYSNVRAFLFVGRMFV